MKNILYFAAILFVLSSCGRKTLDEQLVEQCKEFTKNQCPQKLDEYTILDSLSYDISTRTKHFYHTLRGKLDDVSFFDSIIVEQFRSTSLTNLRNDLSIKKDKEAKINFAFHYKSESTKVEYLNFLFTEKDYNGKMMKPSTNQTLLAKWHVFSRMNCPISENKSTRLDSIWYDSISRTLYYDYTLSGYMDLEKDSIVIDRNKLKKVFKEDETLTLERDQEKLNFSFRYFSSKTHKLITEVLIKNEKLIGK